MKRGERAKVAEENQPRIVEEAVNLQADSKANKIAVETPMETPNQGVTTTTRIVDRQAGSLTKRTVTENPLPIVVTITTAEKPSHQMTDSKAKITKKAQTIKTVHQEVATVNSRRNQKQD